MAAAAFGHATNYGWLEVWLGLFKNYTYCLCLLQTCSIFVISGPNKVSNLRINEPSNIISEGLRVRQPRGEDEDTHRTVHYHPGPTWNFSSFLTRFTFKTWINSPTVRSNWCWACKYSYPCLYDVTRVFKRTLTGETRQSTCDTWLRDLILAPVLLGTLKPLATLVLAV